MTRLVRVASSPQIKITLLMGVIFIFGMVDGTRTGSERDMS